MLKNMTTSTQPGDSKKKPKLNGPVTVYRIIELPREVLNQEIPRTLTALEVIKTRSDDEGEEDDACIFEIDESINIEISEGHLGESAGKLKIRRKYKKRTRPLEDPNAEFDDSSIEQRNYPCLICQKTFKHTSHLKRHINTHTGERTYQCDVCEKMFLDASTLSRHRKIHSGEKPWPCKICGKCFSTVGSLRRHITVHNQAGRPYHCETCDKRFPDNSSFRKHKFIHTGIKPHVCDICSKAFVHIGDLNGHRKIHVAIKPFTCQRCGKDFAKQSNYARHLTIHEGSMEYICNICGVGYNYQSSLTRHLLTHVRKNRKDNRDSKMEKLMENRIKKEIKGKITLRDIKNLRRSLKNSEAGRSKSNKSIDTSVCMSEEEEIGPFRVDLESHQTDIKFKILDNISEANEILMEDISDDSDCDDDNDNSIHNDESILTSSNEDVTELVQVSVKSD